MFTAYIAVTAVAAMANAYSVFAALTRVEWIVTNMNRYGVPLSWLPTLGVLKAAGALGLLVGIGVPAIGVAAAVGLILYFVGATIAVVRGRWYLHILFPVGYLLLAVGSLVLLLASL